ncbi:MAG: hypothetical protein U1E93_10940 [Alphaproteobacteria bacterium]
MKQQVGTGQQRISRKETQDGKIPAAFSTRCSLMDGRQMVAIKINGRVCVERWIRVRCEGTGLEAAARRDLNYRLLPRFAVPLVATLFACGTGYRAFAAVAQVMPWAQAAAIALPVLFMARHGDQYPL